jgi:WS/DGAT/MGAT family acyltransferase
VCNSLSERPSEEIAPFWEKIPQRKRKKKVKEPINLAKQLKAVAKALTNQTQVMTDLYLMAIEWGLHTLNLRKTGFNVPFTAPESLLNEPVSRGRRVTVLTLPMDEAKALAKKMKTTLNVMILTLSDMALGKYLRDRNALTEEPLVISMPVSLRKKGDTGTAGNSVGFINVTLSKNATAPLERMKDIIKNSEKVKAKIMDMSPERFSAQTVVLSGLFDLYTRMPLPIKIKPHYNTVISNVPGPANPLYMGNAKLDRIFPISMLPPGTAMSITIVSYNNQLGIGIVGGRNALPDLHKLSDYFFSAWDELSAAIKSL